MKFIRSASIICHLYVVHCECHFLRWEDILCSVAQCHHPPTTYTGQHEGYGPDKEFVAHHITVLDETCAVYTVFGFERLQIHVLVWVLSVDKHHNSVHGVNSSPVTNNHV